MSRTVTIFVNGIMNWPGDASDWNRRAVTFSHTQSETRAEAFLYFCGPIGRAFGQNRRARKLADLLAQYRGWSITLVGHSNGADVILDALSMACWPKIESLHLVSGACEADCIRNGLNFALCSGRIGAVKIYIAGKDIWLRLANSIAGRLLGYGVMGLHGPLNLLPSVADHVGVLTCPEFGHSTWWQDLHFQRTMRHFV